MKQKEFLILASILLLLIVSGPLTGLLSLKFAIIAGASVAVVSCLAIYLENAK